MALLKLPSFTSSGALDTYFNRYDSNNGGSLASNMSVLMNLLGSVGSRWDLGFCISNELQVLLLLEVRLRTSFMQLILAVIFKVLVKSTAEVKST